MISFKQFKTNYGKQYVALELDEVSAKTLAEWCTKLGLDLTVSYMGDVQDPKDFGFHMTIFHSNNEVSLEPALINIAPIELVPEKVDFLKSREGNPIPILKIAKTSALLNVRKIFEGLGLTDPWPEWLPHISICYNYDPKVDLSTASPPKDAALFANVLKIAPQKSD